tara:strand:- start:30614 stop:31843 length:1230 start_codon:yes stop_codon:yes gene_type:complete
MFSRDNWQEIFHSIKNNKMRTFLTGFSVAWAIFLMVLMLASANGLVNGFDDQMGDSASNAITISSRRTSKAFGGFEAGRRIQFTNDDIEFIKQSFKGDFEYITPVFSKGATARYKRETGAYQINAVNAQMPLISEIEMQDGRFINQNDVIKNEKVVVIGAKIVTDLFKEENPIGKMLEIRGLPYKIIGTYGDNSGTGAENTIYAPITTFQRNYSNTSDINQIQLTYNPKFNLEEAINLSNKIAILLKRRYSISPDDQSALRVDNRAEAFSDIGQFKNVLFGITIVIGMLILISGIVGIGNIMVYIVKERTKEIGIRKALGAKPIDIIELVLLESVFITAISGVGGLLIASGIMGALGPLLDSPGFRDPSVNTNIMVIVTIILIVSGIVAGLLPSIKAARIKPIEALSSN